MCSDICHRPCYWLLSRLFIVILDLLSTAIQLHHVTRSLLGSGETLQGLERDGTLQENIAPVRKVYFMKKIAQASWKEEGACCGVSQDPEGKQRREELKTGKETDPSMHWFEAAANMEAVNGRMEAGHLVGLIGWLFLAGPNLEVRWG